MIDFLLRETLLLSAVVGIRLRRRRVPLALPQIQLGYRARREIDAIHRPRSGDYFQFRLHRPSGGSEPRSGLSITRSLTTTVMITVLTTVHQLMPMATGRCHPIAPAAAPSPLNRSRGSASSHQAHLLGPRSQRTRPTSRTAHNCRGRRAGQEAIYEPATKITRRRHKADRSRAL